MLLTPHLKKMLTDSLVLSTFNYCDVVYGPCLTAFDSQRIQKMQNYCLRFIFGLKKHEPVSHKLSDVNWLKMKERRRLHCATLYHKILITKTPLYLYKRLNFRTDVHNLNLRNRGLLTPPFHRTAFFERSFSYNVPALYNGVALSLGKLSLSGFASEYRKIVENVGTST